MIPRNLAVALALSFLPAGCKRDRATADGLMGRTTIGQNRCSEVDPTDRPFVVEWDATDTAMFESLAQRDVVFVRYEACELEVLTACNDDGIAGRYGAYNPPMWTSGSVEGFDVRDEYDLYAKLPLGASSLAAKVAGGATLKLKYFISGTVMATRGSIGTGDLADNPRCAGATHFVQAYNLGAFQLDATEGNEQRVDAKHQGIAAGGGHERAEARLKQGGDLASCTADEAKELSRCQVPIRLVMRALDQGTATGPSAPEPRAAAPSSGPAPDAAGSAITVAALYESALRKQSADDGAGCLADLDRARELDRNADKRAQNIRAVCEMKAGRCQDGKKRYRKFLQQSMTAASMTAGDLDAGVLSAAAQHCTGKDTGPHERAVRLGQDIETASRKPDPASCARLGAQLVDLVAKMPMRDNYEKGAQAMANSALVTAARCADSLGRCADAKKLLRGYVDNNPGFAKERDAIQVAFANAELKRCKGK
ncbi:MAG TPA: hypothetical protein VFG69_12940 [Nannocystaceae bacterium]|nr:hypothetical protein [Nannocystaceae bacterium]